MASNPLTGDDRSQWSISAGQTLGGDQNVGLHAPMIDGEIASRAAHTCHDLVGNQEDTMAFADLSYRLQISWRRNYGSEGRSADWLEDERCGLPSRSLDSVF